MILLNKTYHLSNEWLEFILDYPELINQILKIFPQPHGIVIRKKAAKKHSKGARPWELQRILSLS